MRMRRVCIYTSYLRLYSSAAIRIAMVTCASLILILTLSRLAVSYYSLYTRTYICIYFRQAD